MYFTNSTIWIFECPWACKSTAGVMDRAVCCMWVLTFYGELSTVSVLTCDWLSVMCATFSILWSGWIKDPSVGCNMVRILWSLIIRFLFHRVGCIIHCSRNCSTQRTPHDYSGMSCLIFQEFHIASWFFDPSEWNVNKWYIFVRYFSDILHIEKIWSYYLCLPFMPIPIKVEL